MRLYSYVVARDYGFAPNPFYGVCTLAACKPNIRRMAVVGDWVVGTGSKTRGRAGRFVYAMRVGETVTYDEYWQNPRFAPKKPNFGGSNKQAYGDNIYHRDVKDGHWIQEYSHHSLPGGRPNPRNIKTDTRVPRVLIAEGYVYWGGDGPVVPTEFRDFDGYDICATGQNHKSVFPQEFVKAFTQWFGHLGDYGCVGRPLDWPTSD